MLPSQSPAQSSCQPASQPISRPAIQPVSRPLSQPSRRSASQQEGQSARFSSFWPSSYKSQPQPFTVSRGWHSGNHVKESNHHLQSAHLQHNQRHILQLTLHHGKQYCKCRDLLHSLCLLGPALAAARAAQPPPTKKMQTRRSGCCGGEEVHGDTVHIPVLVHSVPSAVVVGTAREPNADTIVHSRAQPRLVLLLSSLPAGGVGSTAAVARARAACTLI
jgi:hypothetical protein